MAVTRCFCGGLPEGLAPNTLTARIRVEWGDERGIWEGDKSFCSFSCLGRWAYEKGAEHDGRSVLSMPERTIVETPIVDRETDRLIR